MCFLNVLIYVIGRIRDLSANIVNNVVYVYVSMTNASLIVLIVVNRSCAQFMENRIPSDVELEESRRMTDALARCVKHIVPAGPRANATRAHIKELKVKLDLAELVYEFHT